MIKSYGEHRKNLINRTPKKWKGIVAEDYGLLLQINGGEKPMTKHDINAACDLANDATELLDKAEERDKDVKRVEVLENIIEKIHAMASKESPSLYQKIIDISANAIEDPAPVEKGKR